MLGFKKSLSCLSYLLIALSWASDLDPNNYSEEDIIDRDVVIVGGGSSGIYTAVRLTDYNKSVVVVEKQNHLGGHAETYTDPATNKSIDIGVIVFDRLKVVYDYFARFNVPLMNYSTQGSAASLQNIDFSTGQVQPFKAPSQQAVLDALDAYTQQLEKYPSLEASFNLSYPIAPDILLPFGEFVDKFNLSAMMYPLIYATNQGYAPLANLTTLYMLKYLEREEVGNLKASSFLTTTHHNISELYARAGAYLGGPNVLLNTNITAMSRSSSPISVAVQTPQGHKLIRAQKLVAALPPSLSTLTNANFDLSEDETALFAQFFANGYYTGLLRGTGFPANTSLLSIDPTQKYSIPQLPGIYALRRVAGTDLTSVYYGSSTVLSNEEVQADILATIKRLQEVRGLDPGENVPEWVIFSSHAPFNLQVSAEAIQDRFYERLFALQGERGTYWNGAAWQSQDSSVIWEFTENEVLPKILGAA